MDSLDVFTVCSLEGEDIRAACNLGWSDFKDALIEVSAQKVDADYLVTRDDGFERSRIPVRNPEQIIEMLKERGLIYEAVDLDSLDFE